MGRIPCGVGGRRVADAKAGHVTYRIAQTNGKGMGCPFFRLIMTGMRKLSRATDKPFFIIIVETEQPGPPIDGLLPDDIVEMIVDPAFPAGFLPFSPSIHVCQRNPKECRIRQSDERCFTSCLFHLPLQDEELAIISQLGIQQQQQ